MSSAIVRDDETRHRNRQVLRILLAVMAALALATLLVGIRW
ncbi:MAG: hypothetical protein ACREM3_31545 [Candidatus Rokuibacteriota bacterium]